MVHLVFLLRPTPFSLFPVNGACQELGLRTLAALVTAWPRESLTLLRKGQAEMASSCHCQTGMLSGAPLSHTQGLCDSSLLQPSCADLTRSHWKHPPPPTPQVLPALKPILSSLASLAQLMTPGDLDGQLRTLPCPPLPCGGVDRTSNPARGLKLGGPLGSPEL